METAFLPVLAIARMINGVHMANKKLPSKLDEVSKVTPISAAVATSLAKSDTTHVKFSEMQRVSALSGDEVFPLLQGGGNVAATINQIKALIPAGADGKDGVDGKDGAPGKDGVNGKDGADGKDGTDGTEVLIGSEDNNALVNNKDSADGPLGLKVLVSKDLQNELFILQDEKNPGLYARPISAMLFAEDDSIFKTSAYEGNPKNAAIKVRISAKAGNSIQLVTSTTEGGLYVPEKSVTVDEDSINGTGSADEPLSVHISTEEGNALSVTEKGLWAKDTISSLNRNGASFNFSVSHPDVKTAEYACGPMGKGVYFKSTLSVPSSANHNVVNQIYLERIPCMADGTLVSYDTWCAAVNGLYRVPIWMICHERPTHTLTISTGVIAPITRVTDKESGLPDYPEAAETDVNVITYQVLQFYSKQS